MNARKTLPECYTWYVHRELYLPVYFRQREKKRSENDGWKPHVLYISR